MQCPYARLLVELRLGDLDQRVQMGRRPVRQFVADGRRGHAAGPAQEERAAQLPLQVRICEVTAGWERPSRAAALVKETRPVHRDERAQQGCGTRPQESG